MLPGRWRLEARQAEQALIHNRHRVGHRLALRFADGNLRGLLRRQFFRRVKLRLQLRRRVFHHQRNHAVHADRQVVLFLFMRLQEGDVRIDVRRHIAPREKLVGRGFFFPVDPCRTEHFVARFDTDQSASGFAGRNCQHNFFADKILWFIR